MCINIWSVWTWDPARVFIQWTIQEIQSFIPIFSKYSYIQRFISNILRIFPILQNSQHFMLPLIHYPSVFKCVCAIKTIFPFLSVDIVILLKNKFQMNRFLVIFPKVIIHEWFKGDITLSDWWPATSDFSRQWFASLLPCMIHSETLICNNGAKQLPTLSRKYFSMIHYNLGR